MFSRASMILIIFLLQVCLGLVPMPSHGFGSSKGNQASKIFIRLKLAEQSKCNHCDVIKKLIKFCRIHTLQEATNILVPWALAGSAVKFACDAGQFGSDFNKTVATIGSDFNKTVATIGGDFNKTVANIGGDFNKTVATIGGDFNKTVATIGSDFNKTVANIGGDFKTFAEILPQIAYTFLLLNAAFLIQVSRKW
jgi:hypothetical protein